MSPEVTRLDLRLRRRLLLAMAIGAAGYVLAVVAMYPSFRDDTSLDSMLTANPAAAAAFGLSGSMTSPSGWLNANVYANIGPLLTLLLSLRYGAGALAARDDAELLPHLVTLPLGRMRLVLEKALALLVVSAVVPLASGAICLLGPRFGLTPSWSALGGVTVACALLGFGLGAVALLLGALTGSRGLALGVSGGVAAAAYLVSALAPVVHPLHGVRRLSPFFWAVGDDQLARGVPLVDLLALLGLGVVLVLAAVPAFRRLDVP